jgi:hypothetical protein
MTSPDRVSDPAPARDVPRVAPGRMRAPQGRRCAKCGAVGTHYLTCPSLRLPAHYRVGADIAPTCSPPQCHTRCGQPGPGPGPGPRPHREPGPTPRAAARG